MKNKKIISLVCAISMIITMFSAFTVAHAEDVGMTIDVAQKSKTEFTITAKYVGFENGIIGGVLDINLPEGAKVKPSTTLSNAKPDGTPSDIPSLTPNPTNNVVGADGKYRCVVGGLLSNATSADNTMIVLDVTLAEELTTPFKVKLQEKTSVVGFDTDGSTEIVASFAEENLKADWVKLEAKKVSMSNSKSFLTTGLQTRSRSLTVVMRRLPV